ncbi:RidA family protein [Nonomuraea bangladeshensis]|uniref:RidA family protein n=1 Tax=Nonomuraea bangladeshensis TaxID=404385 RepID=UPI003C2C901B
MRRASPARRLAELGLKLPPVSPAKGSYVPAVAAGDLLFVSGQVPMADGEVVLTGRVGDRVTVETAVLLSRQCALAALAAADATVGLDRIVRVVKVVGYVSSAPGFTAQANVVNGASDLLFEVFGEAGQHARTSIGVAALPLDAPVEIELTVQIAPEESSVTAAGGTP